jgi:hypothetical protein
MVFTPEDLKHLKNYLRFASMYVQEQLDKETSVDMAEVEREELRLIKEMYVRVVNNIG